MRLIDADEVTSLRFCYLAMILLDLILEAQNDS